MLPVLVEVRARYPGSDGLPASGYVSFRLTGWAQNTLVDTITAPAPVVVELDSSGACSVRLVPTDDPSLVPQGLAYEVAERVNGRSRSYRISVPAVAAAGGLELADQAPVVEGPLIVQYALAADVADQRARLAAVELALGLHQPFPSGVSFPTDSLFPT